MKSRDFSKFGVQFRRWGLILTGICLLGNAWAKSDAASQQSPPPDAEVKPLILTLPDTQFNANKASRDNLSAVKDNSEQNQQFIAGSNKKRPINLDCGMDVYQNTGPDIPITSRLTGECDFKYHY